MLNKKKITMEDYLTNGIYAVMRKCPTAHNFFGYSSILDLPVPIFRWVLEQLSKEFKQADKKGK